MYKFKMPRGADGSFIKMFGVFFFSISFGFGLYFLFYENDKSSISSCITYLYHDELTDVSAREPFHRQLQPDCYCFDWLFSQISNFAKFCDPSRRMWAFRLFPSHWWLHVLWRCSLARPESVKTKEIEMWIGDYTMG